MIDPVKSHNIRYGDRRFLRPETRVVEESISRASCSAREQASANFCTPAVNSTKGSTEKGVRHATFECMVECMVDMHARQGSERDRHVGSRGALPDKGWLQIAVNGTAS